MFDQIDPVLVAIFGYLLVPLIQRLKATRLATYVRGSGWTVMALLLGAMAQIAWALVWDGLPTTPDQWQPLIQAGAATGALAGAYYDLLHNDGRLIALWRAHLGDHTVRELQRASNANDKLAKRTRRAIGDYADDVGLDGERGRIGR